MKLDSLDPSLYRVKKGQRLFDVARRFSLPPRVLAAYNELKEEIFEGQVLKIPAERRNLYAVKGGESMTLLCGSQREFEARNRTKWLYPGQIVWL